MRSARRDSPSLRLMGLVGFRRGRGPEQIYDATGQWTRQPIAEARTYLPWPGFRACPVSPPMYVLPPVAVFYPCRLPTR